MRVGSSLGFGVRLSQRARARARAGAAAARGGVRHVSSKPPSPLSEDRDGDGRPLTVESSSNPDQLDKQPLPYLSVALGVAQAPSSAAASWTQKRAALLDQERRMASRRAIVKQATRGYFHDFHAMRSHGGKTWRAPPTLIRHDRALFFPDIAGTSLADKATRHTTDLWPGKVSLVSILNSKISEEHVKSFTAPTIATYGTHPRLQLVQLNMQENALKAYLLSLFMSALRAHVPTQHHHTYLLSHQNLDLVRDAIGYHNKHVGYTYLVGPDAKIRWAGCAFAEPEEATALKACTGVLLNRADERERK